MRRRILLSLTLAICVAPIIMVAAAPRSSFLRQTNESNGHREPEYGVFGVTVYQPSQSVPGLNVSHDLEAGLNHSGLENHPQVQAQLDKATRTIRKEETQYWLRIDVKASPKEIVDTYARQLKKARRWAMSKGEEVEGLCPDGHTRVQIMADRLGAGTTDVLVTFSVPR